MLPVSSLSISSETHCTYVQMRVFFWCKKNSYMETYWTILFNSRVWKHCKKHGVTDSGPILTMACAAPSGNWTQVSHVTGGYTDHYTNRAIYHLVWWLPCLSRQITGTCIHHDLLHQSYVSLSAECVQWKHLRLVFLLSLNLKFFHHWECVLFLPKNISTIQIITRRV